MSKKKKSIPEIVRYIRMKSGSIKPVDYSFQKNISYSQLSLYNQCPYKWARMYKDKDKPFSSSIHTVFGTSIHLVIQHYLTVLHDISGAEADRLDLNEMLQEALQREYKTQYKANNNQHFSSAEEMNEFYQDGILILEFLKKNRGKYFSNRTWVMVGCEIPIILPPHEDYPHLLYLGYLDVVLYNENSNSVKIIDIKSSTRSWSSDQKKDPNKTNQLVLYKKYFADLYKFPIDNIEVEYFILKRKLYEDCDYPQPRIQLFEPASGTGKINKATATVKSFIEECFNQDNTIKEREYEKKPSYLCEWCVFKQDCSKSI